MAMPPKTAPTIEPTCPPMLSPSELGRGVEEAIDGLDDSEGSDEPEDADADMLWDALDALTVPEFTDGY